MTPDDLRRKAAALEERGNALLDEGKPTDAAARFVEAAVYHAAADEMERLIKARGLPPAKRLGTLKGMTPGQIDRRARAIATAHATRKKDKFLQAISASPWRSMNRYARERLGVSPGMLTLYRQGKHPVPPAVAERVLEDLGLPADKKTWPAGVAT